MRCCLLACGSYIRWSTFGSYRIVSRYFVWYRIVSNRVPYGCIVPSLAASFSLREGAIRGLRYALEQVPLVTLFPSLRGYGRLDVSWVVSSAHSRFKLPIPVDANSTCNIMPRSTTAELIRHTKLIVWDKAPMSVWCTRPNTARYNGDRQSVWR